VSGVAAVDTDGAAFQNPSAVLSSEIHIAAMDRGGNSLEEEGICGDGFAVDFAQR